MDEMPFNHTALVTILVAMTTFHVAFRWRKCLMPIPQMERPRPGEAETGVPGYSVTARTKGLLTCRTKKSPSFFLPGFLIASPCNASFQDSDGIMGARPHRIDDSLTSILPNPPWKGEDSEAHEKGEGCS